VSPLFSEDVLNFATPFTSDCVPANLLLSKYRTLLSELQA
jgi:hypothetical protein